ncbi:hypothetical protein PPERSA_07197 [Pseudocohnilembus persalinus]|uniref:Uncharacterized protein n=1 Tax=Pseudocohnilembus persalinus TaxID=266149 RepID=A0A0V0QCZ4_PSEPJ|nr:hypothetical protein PPERSA_07197 [Pseudocohnilembus persalinus]|eukprot:KRX00090.1 hypothetical protein PPERSA_07197 [Pseudocohnilembus persalinus]
MIKEEQQKKKKQYIKGYDRQRLERKAKQKVDENWTNYENEKQIIKNVIDIILKEEEEERIKRQKQQNQDCEKVIPRTIRRHKQNNIDYNQFIENLKQTEEEYEEQLLKQQNQNDQSLDNGDENMLQNKTNCFIYDNQKQPINTNSSYNLEDFSTCLTNSYQQQNTDEKFKIDDFFIDSNEICFQYNNSF